MKNKYGLKGSWYLSFWWENPFEKGEIEHEEFQLKANNINLAIEEALKMKKSGKRYKASSDHILGIPENYSIYYKLFISKKIEIMPYQLTEIQLFWKNLYKKYFNFDIDVSLIKEVEGKWVIFIAKGLTIQQVYDALPFAKWKYVDEDLDKAVPTNDRVSDKDYVVYVDQNVEADEKFKNKSASDLKEMKHKGITLLEYLMLHLKYTEKTGNHLDVDKITLCSGSRYSGGGVPSVDWLGDRLRVRWDGASCSFDYLRSREISF